MEKVKEIIEVLIGGIFSLIMLVFIVILIFGNEENEHFVPVFKGVFYFFHPNNVYWDKQLKSDMETCSYFLAEVGAKENMKIDVAAVMEDIDTFSMRINKYPTDRRQFLINGFKLYVNGHKLLMKDALSARIIYDSTGNYDLKLSDETKKAEYDLINIYKLKDEFESIHKQIEESTKNINKQKSDEQKDNIYTKEELDSIVENYQLQFDEINRDMETDSKHIFKRIFHEELR